MASRDRLAARRKAVGLNQEELADAVGVDRSTVGRWEQGVTAPQPWHRTALAGALKISIDQVAALLDDQSPDVLLDGGSGHEAALELARRVAASDVGDETLRQLEAAVDDFAIRYAFTAPRDLLGDIEQHLGYVSRLVDARKTLDEHRRLLVVGGWLALLGATVCIDLKQECTAGAWLRTAASLARQADHGEIRAWCLETEAWRMLTEGHYPRAVELSQAAQELAPRGSSIAIQAIAQEGRAWARLGDARRTYDAINRTGTLVSPLARPERPEHHYRYDPDKFTAYTATTLAWVGDPAAESYAREIIARLKATDVNERWPRRLASANLDLALTLLVTDRADEACAAAQEAIASGRVVPSNHWRALEVVRAAEQRHLPEARDLREAYETLRST